MRSHANAGFIGAGDSGGGPDVAAAPAARMFVRLLMMVITVLFLLLTLALLMRSQFSDWRSLAGEPGGALTDASRLWLNTAFLLGSSVALQWARVSAGRGAMVPTQWGVALAALLAGAFLLGQLAVWNQLGERGFLVASNPATSFFYLITALHGAHLLGGLVALAWAAPGVWRGSDAGRVHVKLALCSTYWHFLFVVWVAMFALLTRPPESLAALAAICGIGPR
jgi:cytochrome c oxidase subunit 3